MGKSYIGWLFEISAHERVSGNGSVIGLLGQTSYNNYNTLMQGKSNDDLEDLKNTLEFFYYGKHSDGITNKAYADVQNAFQKAVEAEMERIVQNGVNGITEEGVTREKIGNTKHTNYITVGTVQGRMRAAQALLAENLGERFNNVIQIREVLRDLITDSEQILSQVSEEKLSSGNLKSQIKLSGDEKGPNTLLGLVKQFDNNWIRITQAKKYASLAALGKLGEKGVAAISELVNASIDENVDQLVDNALKNAKIIGNVKASADQLITVKPQITYADENGVFLSQNKKGQKIRKDKTVIDYTYQESVRGDDGAEASVSVQAINNFNQKMDVNYIGPNDENYRISMKTWSSMGTFQNDKGQGQARNLGDTTLYNALLRTVNYDPTIAFGLSAGWGKQKDVIGLSKWAKTIAALDIIAGIGQSTAVGSGHADTLVIQDRSLQQFHVFSIAELIKGFLVNGEAQGFHLVGYDEGAITRNGLNYNSPLGAQKYASKIANILKGQQITVAYTNKT